MRNPVEVNLKAFPIAIRNFSDYEKLKSFELSQVILEPQGLSKLGRLNIEQLQLISNDLKSLNASIFLNIDILMDELDVEFVVKKIESLIPFKFDALRVLDPGIAYWLTENYPHESLHLIIDKHSHNTKSILGWEKIFKSQLSRIVLSSEIPFEKLKEINKQLTTETEILGLGQIEVFYSPRSLIKPHLNSAQEKEIYTTSGYSEDRPYQTIPFTESEQGSFMFNDKDLMILQSAQEIEESGVSYVRLEPYSDETLDVLIDSLSQKDWINIIKRNWPRKTTRGFFRTNKTDAPFKRLTNSKLKPYLEQKVGKVLESKKNAYCVLQIDKRFLLGSTFLFINPEGEEVLIQNPDIQDLAGRQLKLRAEVEPGLYKIPWKKRIQTSSIVCRDKI